MQAHDLLTCETCHADGTAAEVRAYRDALEWIRHQCGVSTVDDAAAVMCESYEVARKALGL